MAVTFLTQDWLDLGHTVRNSVLPLAFGQDVSFEVTVDKLDGSTVTFFLVIVSGQIAKAQLGPLPTADLHFRMPVELFTQFEQGAIKDLLPSLVDGSATVSGDLWKAQVLGDFLGESAWWTGTAQLARDVDFVS